MEETFSKKSIILVLLLLLGVGIVSSYMAYLGLIPLIKELYLSESIVTLNKSFYYCLGISITIIGGFINVFLYRLIGLPLGNRYVKLSGIPFYTGIVLFLIFPHVMYFSLDYYLENKKGYYYCQERSIVKLALVRLVYTETLELCAEGK